MNLHKDDIRVRRRIMHILTRQMNKEHPDKREAFNAFFKSLIHDAITFVLADERMEKRNADTVGGRDSSVHRSDRGSGGTHPPRPPAL